jgi:hypothetical protein
MQELEIANERFAKRIPKSRCFSSLSPGQCAEPYDAGLVVIDFVARLVVVDSTYSSPGPEGTVWYHDGRCCTDARLRYHLADDWRFSSDGDHLGGACPREVALDRHDQLMSDLQDRCELPSGPNASSRTISRDS